MNHKELAEKLLELAEQLLSKKEYAAAGITVRTLTDSWYDWFMDDEDLSKVAGAVLPLAQAMVNAFSEKFTDPRIFLKESLVMSGGNVVMIQLYEEGYPKDSFRVVCSCYTLKDGDMPFSPDRLELSVWNEGGDMGSPVFTAGSLSGMVSKITGLRV